MPSCGRLGVSLGTVGTPVVGWGSWGPADWGLPWEQRAGEPPMLQSGGSLSVADRGAPQYSGLGLLGVQQAGVPQCGRWWGGALL